MGIREVEGEKTEKNALSISLTSTREIIFIIVKFFN